MVVLVYYTTLLDNRDFLFEPITSTILLYTHLINNAFHSIIARNNISKPIVLPKYLRLGIVSKINYNNYYLTTTEEVDFTIIDSAS